MATKWYHLNNRQWIALLVAVVALTVLIVYHLWQWAYVWAVLTEMEKKAVLVDSLENVFELILIAVVVVVLLRKKGEAIPNSGEDKVENS